MLLSLRQGLTEHFAAGTVLGLDGRTVFTKVRANDGSFDG